MTDTDGIAVAANALELNGGTIKSSGSVDANLAHTALTTDVNHKVDGSGTRDTTAPTVSIATVNGSDADDHVQRDPGHEGCGEAGGERIRGEGEQHGADGERRWRCRARR